MKYQALLMAVLFVTPLWAATVHLKDGGKVEGNIVEENSQAIRIESSGAITTYFSDEVLDVNGRPLGGVKSLPVQKSPIAKSSQRAASKSPEVKASPILPEKRELILKFMEVFGSKDALRVNFANMIKQAESTRPEEAAKIKERINVDELIEELLPVYDRNFTEQDLKDLIAFYSSPAGQKIMSSMPNLMKESVVASTRYIQRKFPELGD